MHYKISIKHQLNKSIKPVSYLSADFYPLQMMIDFNGKKYRIKSRIGAYLKIYSSPLERLTKGDKQLTLLFSSGLFSQPWLNAISKDREFPVFSLLEDEINAMTRVIEMMAENKGRILTSQLGHNYENCLKEITDVIDDYIKTSFQEELKELFLNLIDSTEKKDLFKTVNYFIHFINWNHPFYNVYDSSSEIMPGELKKIESCLSGDLRLSIKAYTAFYNYINPLKRFFEKREQGRIATLSYLDWNSDIKAMLKRQFASMIGIKAATRYIRRLDEILNDCLGCRV
jgi:hypothetical protein